jgi:hypothetical protein
VTLWILGGIHPEVDFGVESTSSKGALIQGEGATFEET